MCGAILIADWAVIAARWMLFASELIADVDQ